MERIIMGFSNYQIAGKPEGTSKSNLIYITYTKYENDWPSFMHTHPFTELFLVKMMYIHLKRETSSL